MPKFKRHKAASTKNVALCNGIDLQCLTLSVSLYCNHIRLLVILFQIVLYRLPGDCMDSNSKKHNIFSKKQKFLSDILVAVFGNWHCHVDLVESMWWKVKTQIAWSATGGLSCVLPAMIRRSESHLNLNIAGVRWREFSFCPKSQPFPSVDHIAVICIQLG